MSAHRVYVNVRAECLSAQKAHAISIRRDPSPPPSTEKCIRRWKRIIHFPEPNVQVARFKLRKSVVQAYTHETKINDPISFYSGVYMCSVHANQCWKWTRPICVVYRWLCVVDYCALSWFWDIFTLLHDLVGLSNVFRKLGIDKKKRIY